MEILIGTPSIHDAAVRATTKAGDGIEGKELGAKTVKLFDCTTISQMIQESMSWWSLLRRFIPKDSRKVPYTCISGVVIQPYLPQHLHEHKGVQDDAATS